MKLTKSKLKQIIKEEKHKLLSEQTDIGNERLTAPVKGVSRSKDQAVEDIEAILNELWDGGSTNEDLVVMLERLIKGIGSGFIGKPT